MIDYEVEQWNDQPELRAVVAAYADAMAKEKHAASQMDLLHESVNKSAADDLSGDDHPQVDTQASDGDDSSELPAGSGRSDAGWVARLIEVEGIDPERLSRLHGQLIALGFLKFRLADRNSGVFYQVTPQAARLLARTLEHEATSHSAEETTPEDVTRLAG